ncbi:MAG: PadR family transcriptional regulator [bacterium]|nr:PadR family transcriptional regulator [bacterium]
MEILSKPEELILLSIWRLKDDAYGVTVRKHIKEITGKDFSISGIYLPLERLVRKGFLEAYQGDPSPVRGGMSKRYYRLTEEGVEALKESRDVLANMWDGLPETSMRAKRVK